MPKTKVPQMPSGLLPKLTYKDGERLNRCIELLDAADLSLKQNRNSTQVAVCRLLYEAQKPIIEIRDKIFAAIQRWAERENIDLEAAISGAPPASSPGDDQSGQGEG